MIRCAAGRSSPAVFRAYLDGLEAARGSKVVSVRFKDKSHGWSHPWFTAQFADGRRLYRGLQPHRLRPGLPGCSSFLRPACARCRYTSTSRPPADFTPGRLLGPGREAGLPVERDKGVSMVLVNSARGQAVFDALSPRFGQVGAPLAEAVAGNPPGWPPPESASPRRAAFFAAFSCLCPTSPRWKSAFWPSPPCPTGRRPRCSPRP
ncbi:MAG: Coenzyme F420 hydrogenase/dehydrogenase, beta subunit C-terminal domain [Flavonifractor plautii]